MFATSSQRKYWTFSGETELAQLRKEANERYIKTHGTKINEDSWPDYFFTVPEERVLCRHFEFLLKEFCSRFQPPMPKYVLGTSLCYFKRFYVHTSVMDYHPKEIMLTCVYMACKVEEFNVSIGQFVGNLKGDREKFANIVLGFELLLMDKLHYHLTVHNPFRPLEGLFIDIKTRCKKAEDIEKLRKDAEAFIEKSLASDACLVFAPSQIALAAILSVTSREGINLDSYVTDVLLEGASEENLKNTIYQIKRIKYMVKAQEPIARDQIQRLQRKLQACRNQDNNPESDVYQKKMEEMFDDEEENRSRKRARYEEEEEAETRELLGV
ncbi:hypothetical protein ScPMuIL_002745 [Solemya velum]